MRNKPCDPPAQSAPARSRISTSTPVPGTSDARSVSRPSFIVISPGDVPIQIVPSASTKSDRAARGSTNVVNRPSLSRATLAPDPARTDPSRSSASGYTPGAGSPSACA